MILRGLFFFISLYNHLDRTYMLPNTLDLLEAFKSLPTEEQQAFFKEIERVIHPISEKYSDLPIISKGSGLDASRLRQKFNIQTESEIDEWVKNMRNEWDRGF